MPRQKEFDPDLALDKAMRFFWKNGYRNTSIRDLIANTGVNFYGLYNVFGDKRGIYMKGLDKYMNQYISRIRQAGEGAADFNGALKQVFGDVLKIVTSENDNAGCMACNAAVEVAAIDSEIADRVLRHRASLERVFMGLQERFLADNNQVDRSDYKARAEFLCSQVYSMGLLVRSQCSQAVLKRHMETTVKLMS